MYVLYMRYVIIRVSLQATVNKTRFYGYDQLGLAGKCLYFVAYGLLIIIMGS